MFETETELLFDYESIIDCIINEKKPPSNLNVVRELCIRVKRLLLVDPPLIHLSSARPITISGCFCGSIEDLIILLSLKPPSNNSIHLFLGSYVDRGKNSIECICLLYALKLKFPGNIFLLRGKHEIASINRIYGFYNECKQKYNVKIWKTFTDTFNCLPIASIIDNQFFCVAGGLSPDLKTLTQIENIVRPTDCPDTGLLCDLIWSDPDAEFDDGWHDGSRGISFSFGKNIVEQFLIKFKLKKLIRTSLVDNVEERWGGKCVTIFGSSKYVGEFDNLGCAAVVHNSEFSTFSWCKQ